MALVESIPELPTFYSYRHVKNIINEYVIIIIIIHTCSSSSSPSLSCSIIDSMYFINCYKRISKWLSHLRCYTRHIRLHPTQEYFGGSPHLFIIAIHQLLNAILLQIDTSLPRQIHNLSYSLEKTRASGCLFRSQLQTN